MHAVDDIRRKGSTKNFSTRPGEGFQQEVRETYHQTNFRDVLAQVSDRKHFSMMPQILTIKMAKIDENMEVMAQIKMNVDTYDAQVKAQQSASECSDRELAPDRDEREDEIEETGLAHCAFGSAIPGSITSHNISNNFDTRIRRFLQDEFEIQIDTREHLHV